MSVESGDTDVSGYVSAATPTTGLDDEDSSDHELPFNERLFEIVQRHASGLIETSLTKAVSGSYTFQYRKMKCVCSHVSCKRWLRASKGGFYACKGHACKGARCSPRISAASCALH
eukprot:Gregarina_sp_Poly_1__1321@NODE_1325_length_4376_cov_38_204224_g893_i0_p5_GENE_NODE_1325_length_4376_cov_38_204224_g893_i0NODE_1325_length_4376_cov_38_204224_g893_i0_p5_ORF_typecomplete_len116_score9_51_NODE_1325_length_4376_cov_38_204224_g893_i0619966